MKIVEKLQNIIRDCVLENKKEVTIPMEMAVKIVFSLGMIDQIMSVTENVEKHKYTELEKTIEVEQQTGEWKYNETGTISCSECGTWFPVERKPYLNFCGYCGAKMRNR